VRVKPGGEGGGEAERKIKGGGYTQKRARADCREGEGGGVREVSVLKAAFGKKKKATVRYSRTVESEA